MKNEKKFLTPAIRSGISYCFYLVLIIVIWAVIGAVVYPQQPLNETAKSFAEKYEKVLIQISENLQDETVNEGILLSSDVTDILSEGNIASQYADEYGAAFVLKGTGVPEDGSALILYRPDGYVFTGGADIWTKQEGAEPMLWTSPLDSNAYVKVWNLTDTLWLEVTVQPS